MTALTLLEILLDQDGIRLPRGGGAEKAVNCFSPHHEDKTASMSVNVAKGLFNCHGCGFHGNAYQYLTDGRGLRCLPPEDAKRVMREAGAHDGYVRAAVNAAEDAQRRDRREPPSTKEPYNKAKVRKDVLGDRVALYDYPDADGRLVFKVGRYEATVDDKDKPIKTFRPFTPKPDGSGYWAVGPMSDQLEPEHRIRAYPIYRLPAIAEAVRSWTRLPDAARRQIWVVEGEKCANLVGRLKNPKGISPLVCSLYGGTQHPVANHDLSILYGQEVLLIADADDGGRAYMRKLGKALTDAGSNVRFILPPGDDTYDIGNAAAGGWDAMLAFVKKVGVQSYEEVIKVREPDPTHEPVPDLALADTPYFRVMGFEGEQVVLQSKTTHRIHKIKAGAVGTEGNLIHLAPLAFWRSLAGNQFPTNKHRAVWTDGILRAAEHRGEISTTSTRMWARGALRMDDGRIVYNIGNAVLEADRDGLLTRPRPLTQDIESPNIFLPGPKIELQDNERAPFYASDLHDAVLRYRWDREEDGHTFLGWLVTSLVGGALPFRPAIWLTGESGSGKTGVFDEILNPFFGNLLSDMASATEAGIAGQTADTSLPAYLDEFEPEPGKEQRMNDILTLLRTATSGSGSRTRGTQQGGYTQTRVRFSLLMTSIDRPPLRQANATRIRLIRLANEGVPDWPAVRDAIRKAVRPDRALALRTYIIRNTQKIVQHAEEIENEMLAEEVPTREAQITAALSAGVCFLSNEDTFRLGRQPAPLSDTYRPFVLVMTAPVRTRFEEDTTIAATLKHGYFDSMGRFLYDDATGMVVGEDQLKARKLAEQHGFKMEGPVELLCAVGFRTMEGLLARTPYERIDLSDHILRLPGAYRPTNSGGQPRRLHFAGAKRNIIAVPRETLATMGLLSF